MSYNTPETAEAIVGVALSEELLDEAQSLIHQVTEYRWETTEVTDTFSSRSFGMPLNQNILLQKYVTPEPRDELSIFLRMPVIDISAFTIDDTDQTESTDYELKEDIGEIRLVSFAFFGNSSLTGTDDISITYTYGYGEDHKFFPIVRGIEARVALLLYRNPLLLSSVNLQGDVCNYGDDRLEALLKRVPQPVKIWALS